MSKVPARCEILVGEGLGRCTSLHMFVGCTEKGITFSASPPCLDIVLRRQVVQCRVPCILEMMCKCLLCISSVMFVTANNERCSGHLIAYLAHSLGTLPKHDPLDWTCLGKLAQTSSLR